MIIINSVIDKRWEIKSKISETDLYAIYLTDDRKRKNIQGIVKVFKLNTGTFTVDQHRLFLSELKKLTSIKHPDIACILGYGSLISSRVTFPYIVYELIKGETIYQAYGEVQYNPGKAVELISRIAAVLETIHSKGIIHSSLKTDDILITDCINPRFVLTGLGSARLFSYAVLRESGDVDCFRYMSPEACGITAGVIDQRADLYSLGVIFYRLLTGHYPLNGCTIDEVRHMHAAKKISPPSFHNRLISPELDSIVLKLLSKKPEDRYQSAWKLLDDIKHFRHNVNNLQEFTRLSFVADTVITGRDSELSLLRELLPEGSSGSICYITGEPGSGKTRLVNEFGTTAEKTGYIFIQGKCIRGGSMSPFRPFVQAIESYIEIFKSYPVAKKKTINDYITGKIDYNIAEMTAILPSFSFITGTAQSSLRNIYHSGSFRNLASGIFRFIRLISKKEKGIILFIDDIQWIDEDSRNLLIELAGSISFMPLLLVCASRDVTFPGRSNLSEYISTEKPLSKITEIKLESLGRDDSAILLSRLTGDEVSGLEDISSFVYSAAGGNPFFTIEIIKHLITSGCLVRKGDKWLIDKSHSHSFNLSLDLIDVITDRIKQIGEDERTLFMIAAAYGKPFSIPFLEMLSDIYRFSDYSPQEAFSVPEYIDINSVLASGFEQRFIARDPSTNEYYFWHDRITEIFYSMIPVKRKAEIHGIIARACEELLLEGDRKYLFDTANHFIFSQNALKILKYVPDAAAKAAKMNATEDSIRLYSIAVEYFEKKDYISTADYTGDLKTCLYGLSESLLITGRYDRAISVYNRLLKEETDNYSRAVLYQKLCTAYFKKGQWEKAEKCGETGFYILDESFPVNWFMVIFSSIVEFVMHIIFLCFPILYKTGRNRSSIDYNKLIIDFYNTLCWMYILSNKAKAVRSMLRMLNISLVRIGKSQELALSMGAYACLCMSIPYFMRAEKYHRIALDMRENLGDSWGTAQSLQWTGYMFQWKGDLENSGRCLERSIKKFKDTGDNWETGMSIHGQELNNIYSGNYAYAEGDVEKFIEISRITGDMAGVCGGYNDLIWIKTERGEFKKAEEYADISLKIIEQHNLAFHKCINLSHRGLLYINSGDYRKAINMLESAKKLCYQNSFIDHYVAQLFPQLAEAFILDNIGSRNGKSFPDRRTFLVARKLCRDAIKKTGKWPLHRGDALRVWARLYAAKGRNRKAESLFIEAIEIQKKYGRRFRLAVALNDYGNFLADQGKTEEAVIHMKNACAIFHETGSFYYKNRVLEALENSGVKNFMPDGKQDSYSRKRNLNINTVSDEKNTDSCSIILHDILQVSGAEKGFILINSVFTDEFTVLFESSVNGSHKSDIIFEIADYTFKTGIPYVSSHQFENAKDYRSVACIPVKHENSVVGVCYLDNSLISGIFNNDTVEKVIKFLDDYGSKLTEYCLEIISDTERMSESGGYNPGVLQIKDEGITRLIPYHEIIYISSRGRYIIIYTVERTCRSPVQISKIEDELPENFLRIHKQFIVNLDFVSSVKYLDSNRYMIYMKDDDDTVLQSGRKYSVNIKHCFKSRNETV